MKTKTYSVWRKWADARWYKEAKGLTLRRARNFYFNLLQRDIVGCKPSDLRIMCEQDIFDIIISAVERQTGGVIAAPCPHCGEPMELDHNSAQCHNCKKLYPLSYIQGGGYKLTP